jgi:TolA-binding protein
MSAMVTDADFLKGKRVAFTGRLASMTRKEAAELVRAFGGRFVPRVNRWTSLLIVGHEGWPLRKDGRLTQKLRNTRLLQRQGHSVSVLSEDELLVRLGLSSRSAEIRRLYSTAELANLLKVPRDRLRAWMGAGLIRAVECRHGVAFFDFAQVAGAKTLCDLMKAGVTAGRIQRSLKHLRKWAGSIEQPLEQLAILEKDGSLLVRVGEALADPTGQLILDFGDEATEALAFAEPRLTADEWYDLACQHEDARRLRDAEAAYRQALQAGGPNSEYSFNLANVLYALGRKPEAAERYYQAVETDAANAEAWNNLGVVLDELKRVDEARAAYQKAVELGYDDALYNLADLLGALGENEEAQGHWEAYLKRDPQSEWGRYARARLQRRS